MYLILAEKPSAAANFAKALGGETGTFEGQPYRIMALRGHMMEYVEPFDMVAPELQEGYKTWSLDAPLWSFKDMSFKRRPKRYKNMKTGKVTDSRYELKQIAEAAKQATAIVIATDDDPSGEGQLIGWEVIHAIGYKGDVKRMYFLDEAAPSLQKAFRNMVTLPSAFEDGEYLKADTRSRFDFMTMQLVRHATSVARSKGYEAVVLQGRLKSVMLKLVADQLTRYQNYQKKPYFEVKYRDEQGNVFQRRFDEGDTFRYDKEVDATNEASSRKKRSVQVVKTEEKRQAPSKLLDLGGLSSILGTRGFAPKEVLSTYQKMYEAKIVSYPRTEDRFISTEQFHEMLPLVDRIASVVGVDTALLTHRKPRKTHVKDGGAHGANRPGTVVPSSVAGLTKYGASGPAIYELLAQNFLSMFGEDYVYELVHAKLVEDESFTSTLHVSKSQGYRAIFDTDAVLKDGDDDETQTGRSFGTIASPFVFEGANKRPAHPTHKWLEKQLSRFNVGTGATRVGTLSDITNGKSALLKDTKGKLTLTFVGAISSVLLKDTYIADPKVTEQLFGAMKLVGEKKEKPLRILTFAEKMIQHDRDVMIRNGEQLQKLLGAPPKTLQKPKPKPKVKGLFQPLGQEVVFNREYGGTVFTDDAVRALLTGKAITIQVNGRNVTGVLAEQTYKNQTFFGFKPHDASHYTRENAPFPKTAFGYTFKEEDIAALRQGSRVTIQAISKANKPYDLEVSFDKEVYKGVENYKIIPHFKERKNGADVSRADVDIRWSFGGKDLTDDQIQDLRDGYQVMFSGVSKKKKKYQCNLSLDLVSKNGTKLWEIVPHFD